MLHGDESACGRKNPIAFKKLRKLLAAVYDSLNKAAERIGSEDATAITAEIIARIDSRRAAGRGKT